MPDCSEAKTGQNPRRPSREDTRKQHRQVFWLRQIRRTAFPEKDFADQPLTRAGGSAPAGSNASGTFSSGRTHRGLYSGASAAGFNRLPFSPPVYTGGTCCDIEYQPRPKMQEESGRIIPRGWTFFDPLRNRPEITSGMTNVQRPTLNVQYPRKRLRSTLKVGRWSKSGSYFDFVPYRAATLDSLPEKSTTTRKPTLYTG